MSPIKLYNFEKYSILDIKEYLEQNGFKTEMRKDMVGCPILFILDSDVYIDVPLISFGTILADIHFESYPPTANYDKSKKLYEKLKKKFALKKGESRRKIKDADKMDIKVFS